MEDYKHYVEEGCKSDNLNESAFKQNIVISLLNSLGWEQHDRDIEYEIKMGTTKHKIDYVLKKDNNPVLILEIKSPRNEIENNKDYQDELLSYMKQLDVDYGILYNGKKVLFFKKSENKKTEEKPIYTWKCDNSIKIFEYLKKENFPEKIDKFLEISRNLNILNNAINTEGYKYKSSAEKRIIDKLHKDNKQLEKKFIKEYLEIDIKFNVKEPPMEEDSMEKGKEERKYEVIVCPTHTYSDDSCSGINFIQKTGGYGFVRMNKNKKPKYLAIYELNEKAITHVYKIIEIKRVDKKRDDDEIFKRLKDCEKSSENKEYFEREKGFKEYLKGEKVFFVLEEIKGFNPIPSSVTLNFQGIRYLDSLEKLLKAKDLKEIWSK
jgi:hypothetical protein